MQKIENPISVLYLAPFNDKNVYGEAARANINALQMEGIDVSWRDTGSIPKKLKSESDSIISSHGQLGADYLIIHDRPENFVYSGYFKKCIGLTHLSSNLIEETNYRNYFGIMDSVILDSSQPYDGCINIEPCFDFEQHKKVVSEPKKIPSFDFLMVGVPSASEEMFAVIKAYIEEFRAEELVSITIKLNIGSNPHEIMNMIKATQTNIRKYNSNDCWPLINIDSVWHNRDELLKYYTKYDCFINCSNGNQWSRPLIDNMILGKRCINTIEGVKTYKQLYGVSYDRDFPIGQVPDVKAENLRSVLRNAINSVIPSYDVERFSEHSFASKILAVLNEPKTQTLSQDTSS